MSTSVRMMDKHQRNTMFAIAKELGMVKEDLRSLANTDSLTTLTFAQANKAIARLRERQGDNCAPSKHEHKEVAGMATAAQQRLAWKLVYQLEMLDLKPSTLSVAERLCQVIRKELKTDCHIKNPFAWVNKADCNKLIEKLKLYVASAERRKAKAGDS